MRVLSWNVLRRIGATALDVARHIQLHRPEIVLLQEAGEAMASLPGLVGGHYEARCFRDRLDGLGCWSVHPVDSVAFLDLPREAERRNKPHRIAMLIRIGDKTIANVHLSHGQLLLRRQFAHVAEHLRSPAAVIGDFNVLGSLLRSGWQDLGPRTATHMAKGFIPLRLDRCMTQDWPVLQARALERGRSDHRPIIVDMAGT